MISERLESRLTFRKVLITFQFALSMIFIIGSIIVLKQYKYVLNRDLGFSAQDRDENIRRVGEVAAMFSKAGVVAIAAFISPYAKGREEARKAAGEAQFVEVFLDTPIAECELRDPKGLYKKARAGQISDFTGIDAPYERPEKAEITLRTEQFTPPECIEQIMQFLDDRGRLARK